MKTNINLIWWIAGGAILVWILYLVAIRLIFGAWSEAGTFGDSFGALACLFSLLAFGGVLYTIISDREFRANEAERNYYNTLLGAIDHQITAAKEGGDEADAFDLVMRRKFYSEALEDILTKDRSLPFLKDSDIVRLFCEIAWFKHGEISNDIKQLRRRLRPWGVFEKSKLADIVRSDEIKNEIKKVYIAELQRPESAPFDPHALATWGGLFHARGINESSREMFLKSLRQSPEWKSKNKC